MKLSLKARIATYKVPEDPEQRLFDFYAILLVFARKTDLLPEDVLNFFEHAKTRLVESLYEEMKRLFEYALLSNLELNKALGKKDSKKLESLLGNVSRVKDILGKDLKALPIIREAFRLTHGPGDPWYDQVVPAYERLVEASTLQQKIIAIDHAYDVEHHNGSVFGWDKTHSYDKNGFNWLTRALTQKSKIKEGFEIVQKVSSILRPFYLQALKAQLGKSLDSFVEDKPEGLQKLEPRRHQRLHLNGWYEFPNGAIAKFKDAVVNSIHRAFQVEWAGITLVSGTFEEGEWPGGTLRSSEEWEKWIPQRKLQPPVYIDPKDVNINRPDRPGGWG